MPKNAKSIFSIVPKGLGLCAMMMGLCLMLPAQTITFHASQRTANQKDHHLVQRGETLYGIARQYDLSVTEIKSLNGLKSDKIFVGQLLSIEKAVNSQATQRTRNVDMASADVDQGFDGDLAALFELPDDPTPSVVRPNAVVYGSEAPLRSESSETEWAPESKRVSSIEKNRTTGDLADLIDPEEENSDWKVHRSRSAEPEAEEETDRLSFRNRANAISDKDYPDEPFEIERKIYYQVRANDDIYSIADAYGRTVDELREWNALFNVSPGEVIIVGKYKEMADRSGERLEKTQNLRNSRSQEATGTQKVRGLDNANPTYRSAGTTTKASTFKKSLRPELGTKMQSGSYKVYEYDSIGGGRFYAVHKSLAPGSSIFLSIPNNSGYIEVQIVGRLDTNSQEVIGLSPACVQLLEGVYGGDTATFFFD